MQLARLAAVAIENARLMAESQAANRAKDEFLAVMSHELRTPLTAVLGWTQMLRNRQDDAAAAEKGLEVIERNARSLAQLIEDVLDVSRILTGKLTLHRKAVELAGVVQAAVEVVRPPRGAEGGVAGGWRWRRGRGTVTGDPGRLQQVFWNLLVNAVKFTPGGRAGGGAGGAGRARAARARDGHGAGHPRGVAAAPVRALLAGGRQQHARARGAGAGAGHRPAPGGAARRAA